MKNDKNNVSNIGFRFILNIFKQKSILVVFFISTFTFGQNIIPQDAKVIYEKSSRPCLAITVDPSTDLLKDAWIDFIDKNHDIKLKGNGFLTNKDVLYAENVVLNHISSKALNFYTEIIEDENGATSMKVFAAFGYDIFIEKDTYPNEYAALKKIMTTFLNKYIPEYYNDQIEDAQDEVKDLTKDKGKLDKSIAKNKKKIDKMTDDIEDMKKENLEDQNKLGDVESKLKDKKEKLESLKGKLNGL